MHGEKTRNYSPADQQHRPAGAVRSAPETGFACASVAALVSKHRVSRCITLPRAVVRGDLGFSCVHDWKAATVACK
jgi:hypothetical protein